MNSGNNRNNRLRSPKVIIIVLVYNGLKWLDECLKSVLDSNYHNFEVVVIDNKSKDTSCEYVRNHYPSVKLIENQKNVGTAEGNNIGMRYALKNNADYVVLLNQDIIVDRNWLLEMIKIAEEHKDITILSPMQYDYHGNELDANFRKLLKSTSYFDDFIKKQVQEFYKVNEVIGASMLIKCDMLKKIGLYDRTYFIYFEDPELCRRAIYHGCQIVCIPASKVNHNHSMIEQDKLSDRIKFFIKRNRLIFLIKDPKHPFIHNLKYTFIWNRGRQLFSDIHLGSWNNIKMYISIFLLLPRIFINHSKELKKIPCYLE